ncbi:hypothetical protein EJ03DRAFT_376022 [Teratosphaeria nubilosa]|uniref:Uncharacterized protein n=1 Tax=Teratosphaeria nubilosa TaxID=161662 RepID=A0A6G1L4U7_9PEZI|nr:hypothetical protein EJ03DRAFT_376022 [Teratosphaeria nubilosa]
MSASIQNIREKLRRKLSLHDKNPNFDEFETHEDIDDETAGHLTRELDKLEYDGDKYPQGKPNSFLNKLIAHGNKKTEDEIAAAIAEQKLKEEQTGAATTT